MIRQRNTLKLALFKDYIANSIDEQLAVNYFIQKFFGEGSMTISINKETILDAQRAWGEGIVAISQTHRDGGDFTARAKEHINTLYAYGFADVLFKPTLAAEKQFRGTFDDALDYFIGKEGSEDSGFGIKRLDQRSLGKCRNYDKRRRCAGNGKLFLHGP